MNRNQLPLVIFDGDDTLWATEALYDAARAQSARIAAGAGIDPEAFMSLQKEIDITNVQVFGLSSERFPQSSVDAYCSLARGVGLEPDAATAEAVRKASESVFSTVAPVVDDAASILRALQPSYRLVLLTQGDRSVQEYRIASSGLSELFDHVEIVDHKTADALRALCTRLAADPREGWMVGNSIPSDINPAVSIGMRAVWIDRDVWAHERREEYTPHSQILIATHLSELLELLPQHVRQ
jgi:putative hydrolase of the HAD superfamily